MMLSHFQQLRNDGLGYRPSSAGTFELPHAHHDGKDCAEGRNHRRYAVDNVHTRCKSSLQTCNPYEAKNSAQADVATRLRCSRATSCWYARKNDFEKQACLLVRSFAQYARARR